MYIDDVAPTSSSSTRTSSTAVSHPVSTPATPPAKPTQAATTSPAPSSDAAHWSDEVAEDKAGSATGSSVQHVVSAINDMMGAPSSTSSALTPTPGGWDTVHQRFVGDCYFLSPLAGLAKQNPQAVSNLIHPDGNGQYTVQFHDQPAVTVNDTPLSNGVEANGPWAGILEKAWETNQGNVDTSNNTASDGGGSPSSPITALTGHSTTTWGTHTGGFLGLGLIDTSPKSRVSGNVVNAVRDNDLVTAETGGDPTPGSGLVDDHAYEVVGVDNQGNLELRNPWDDDPATTPEPDGHEADNDDGTFWLTQQQVTHNFNDLVYENASLQPPPPPMLGH